jgi:hypothetical protein
MDEFPKPTFMHKGIITRNPSGHAMALKLRILEFSLVERVIGPCLRFTWG